MRRWRLLRAAIPAPRQISWGPSPDGRTSAILLGTTAAAGGERTLIFQAWVSNRNSVSAQFGSAMFSNSTNVVLTGDNAGTGTTINTGTTTTYLTVFGKNNSASTANICLMQQGMVLLIP